MCVSFACVVTMLFAGFTAAYLIRRAGADWTPIALPSLLWANTLVLLASSATAEAACRLSSKVWLPATMALGLLFLLGQVGAWNQLARQGIYLPTNPHAAFVYVLTAAHGLHLIGGTIALGWSAFRAEALRTVANYWHFMGFVWLYVLLVLGTL